MQTGTRGIPIAVGFPLVRVRLPRLAFYAAGVLLAVVVLFPLLWALSTALRPETELYVYPPSLLPSRWAWENFAKVWTDERLHIALYFRNTVIYAVTRTVLQVILSAMAGYVLARYQFRGRELVLAAVVATVMVPYQIKMVPLFVMLKKVPLAGGNDIFGNGGTGWLDSFPGLILPGVVSGYSIFFLRQFFLTIPRELEDAARIDGCNEFAVFSRIILPLALPAIVALTLFSVQFAWSDFEWPLIITSGERIKTLQLGLAVFNSLGEREVTLLMAGSVLATAPMVVLFVAAQKYIATGINVGVGR